MALCLMAMCIGNAIAQVEDQDCDKELENGSKRYLQQQQKYNYGIVYASCTESKNSSVLLVLPLSNHGPWDDIYGAPREPPPVPNTQRDAGVPALFYIQAGCITNGASLAVEKHYVRLIDIVQGGVPEINYFANVARELSRFPLQFLPPAEVMKVLQAKPTAQCHVKG